MSGVTQPTLCNGYAGAETLYEAHAPHCVGQIGIAVSSQTRLPKIGGVYIAIRPAGADDLNAVIEPVSAHRRIGNLISPMHDCIVHDLLYGLKWIKRALHLYRSRFDVNGNAVVCAQLFCNSAQHIRDRTAQFVIVRLYHPLVPSR